MLLEIRSKTKKNQGTKEMDNNPQRMNLLKKNWFYYSHSEQHLDRKLRRYPLQSTVHMGIKITRRTGIFICREQPTDGYYAIHTV